MYTYSTSIYLKPLIVDLSRPSPSAKTSREPLQFALQLPDEKGEIRPGVKIVAPK